MNDENNKKDSSIKELLEDINSLDIDKDESIEFEVFPMNKVDNELNEENTDEKALNKNIQELIEEKKCQRSSFGGNVKFEDCSSFSQYEEISKDTEQGKEKSKRKFFKQQNKDKKEPKENAECTNKRKFTLFGKEQEEDIDSQFIKKRNNVIEEYKKTGDIPYIKTLLNKEFQSLFVKTIVAAIIMLLVLVPTALIRINDLFPDLIMKNNFSLVFVGYCFLMLISAFLLCFKDMREGLISLFKLEGNCDSAVAFGACCSALQLVVAEIFPSRFVLNGNLPIYTSITLMGIFFNICGKLFVAARVRKNFLFVVSPVQKYAVKVCTDAQQARRVSRSAYNQKTNICYQQKTDFLSDFLKISYGSDSNDYLAYSTALFGAGLSILVAVISGIMKKDFLYAVTALALVSSVCIPMSMMLTVNMQLWSLCKETLKKGCMITGFWSVRHFSDVNSIVVDSGSLYPKGSIVLKGIKTFDANRIDEALLSATAMLIEMDSPLEHVFDEIVQGRKDILPVVDGVEYIDGKGIVGWSKGNRMLIGNRKLLESFRVSVPSIDFENKYNSKGYDITYFASSGKVFAAFILKYNPNLKIMREIQRLEYDGINILVRTVDSNITVERIADNFDVYFKTVKVLPFELAHDFKESMLHSEDKSKAYIASNGKIGAVIRAISGCYRIKSNLSFSAVIQIIAMAIGFLLTSLLIFYSKLEQLGCLELIIFSIFWVFAVLIPSKIKKP